MSRFDGKGRSETGALLGVSETTVENQINHALGILRRGLRGRMGRR